MGKSTKRKIIVLRWITGIVAVVSIAVGYGCAWHTFVPQWEPVVWSVAFGAVMSPLFGGIFSKLANGHFMAGRLIAAALFSALFYGAHLSLNYYCADDAGAEEQTAVVVSKYTEERTRYRRAGRGRSVPDGTYTVYYLRMRFANGVERDFPANAGTYAKSRKGDEKHFMLEKGFFGYTVFKDCQNK